MDTTPISGPVLVGVDGSPPSDVAVVWAARHAQATHRPLAIAHGTGAPDVNSFAFDIPEARQALRDDGARITEAARTLAHSTSPEIDITLEVAVADPRQMLRQRAVPGTLVVLGARGLGRITGLVLGSVASALVGQPPGPVVIARSEPETGDAAVKPVVVGVDGTGSSSGAIDLAYETASREKRPLEAIYGLGVSDAYSYWDLPSDEQLTKLREQYELRVAAALAGHAERFPDVTVRIVLSTDSPAHALRRASKTASMVVLGTRGRGPMTGRLLGSVSRSVVERGRSTVAVVPGEAT